jgi:hypothetical protein
MVLQTLE